MDNNIEKKLGLLKEKLSHEGHFLTDDVCDALGVKRSTASWLLSNLSRAGRIVRLRKGMYTFDTKSIEYRKPKLGGEIHGAVEKLKNDGVSFVLTGMDILLPFVQHMPARITHLLYAAPGAGSWAQSILKDFTLTPVMEPTLQEIQKMLEIIPEESELVVIREKASRLASKDSLATLERAFVDLYFEATRELIPFSVQEVAYIFVNMKSAVALNGAAMLRYAHERKIHREIRDILEFGERRLLPRADTPSHDFLKALEAIA